MDRPRARIGLVFAAALIVCACGCVSWNVPQIDPSGRRLLLNQPAYFPDPGPRYPWSRASLCLTPQQVVAPVGSEVVLVAGVCAMDGRLAVDQEVSFTLEPGGVGHIVDLQRRPLWKWALGPYRWPRKLGPNYSVGMTSDHFYRLTRGTPTPVDDILVRRGETWVTVSSPVEGTSYITAFSPEVYGWQEKRKSAVIEWIDAQWTFPTSGAAAIGSRRALNTMVVRSTNQQPMPGWTVRYRIAGGAPAGFAPEGAQTVDVPTNDTGQASAEIFQPQPARGETQVEVLLFRPATASSASAKPVANAVISQTWSAPAVAIRKLGPATATPGATLTYQITVTNQGEAPAKGVVVSDDVPAGIAYLDSNPPAAVNGTKLTWNVGELGPGQSSGITLNLRAERAGQLTNCASVATAEGLTAQDCATTRITTTSLEVAMTAPAQAVVGGDVTFDIVITNRGSAPATGLRLLDTFDAGLSHAVANNGPIERDIEDLPPGEQRRVPLTLRVLQAGQLCNTVEVSAAGDQSARAQACVTAVPGDAGPRPGDGRNRPALTCRVTGPRAAAVGDDVSFIVEIANQGADDATGVVLSVGPDEGLNATEASRGVESDQGNLIWRTNRLAVGESQQYEIKCRCVLEARQACVRAAVASREGVRAEGDGCLEIRPVGARPPDDRRPPVDDRRPRGAGRLRLKLFNITDPVRAGEAVVYQVNLTNEGTAPDGTAQMSFTVPEGMTITRFGTRGVQGGRPEFDGTTVRFSNLPEIAPGQTVSFRINARAGDPGRVTVQAEATSSFAEPVRETIATDIVDRQ